MASAPQCLPCLAGNMEHTPNLACPTTHTPYKNCGVDCCVEAIDPELLALIPQPFLTVRPGDQVTIYTDKLHPDYPISRLPDFLHRYAPEVTWLFVENVGFTGVVHVSRSEPTPVAQAPHVPAGNSGSCPSGPDSGCPDPDAHRDARPVRTGE